MSRDVALAALLAVATAFFYALSNVLELTEAEQVPDEYSMKAELVVRLAHKPRWVIGMVSDVAGYVCQAGALALATVIFVEPIVATGILMALVIAAVATGRPVRRRDWRAAIVLTVGLAAFLYEVSPTGGRDLAPTSRWLVVGPMVLAAVVVCIVAARGARGAPRAALLGVAAGISFGVSAVLTKAFVQYLGDGVVGVLGHWEPYALAVSSIGGLLVAQSAFQTGSMAASVGASEAMGPVAAVVLGVALLDERVAMTSRVQTGVVVVSVVAILWAVLALARAEAWIVEGAGAGPNPGDLALGSGDAT
ncbi:MAG: DMT family transporter [Acidimicrobiia bacterium]